MTATLNGACNNIATTPNFENLAQMLSYDAIWLGLRSVGGTLLSPTELSNIATFIATGRRVVLIGENDNWLFWNGQILGLVGGTFVGDITTTANTILANELTAGVNSVYLPAAGLASGGTALFDQNFATLWGNVLTILDTNVFDDDYWNNNDNAKFAQNVANWICPVPLPGTFWLLGLGLSGLIAARKKLIS